MAKNETPQVVWQLQNDGILPSPAPHGFIARNPVQRTIPPGMTITINLEVRANVPLLAFPSRTHAEDVTVQQIVQAGSDIVVTVANKSQHSPITIDDKEALVNLYPLIFAGIGVGG